MALNIIIKNTFLDVDETDLNSPGGSSRRSSSVPCKWRPGCSFDYEMGTCHRQGSTYSLTSTAPSEEDVYDGQAKRLEEIELPELLDTPSKKALNPAAAEFQMPSYCAAVPSPSGIRLNPEARVFEPMPAVTAPYEVVNVPQMPMAQALPAEVSTVVNAAKMALMASPHVSNVSIQEAPLGQPTTIVAEVDSSAGLYSAGARETLQTAKTALLGAAARSQSTYVLGWEAQPFKDMEGYGGFRGVVGSVPLNMLDTICWDTYKKGFCPRRATCRWCHPGETDLAPIRVHLISSKRGDEVPTSPLAEM